MGWPDHPTPTLTPDPCHKCGAPGTRWSGGEVWRVDPKTGISRNKGVCFVCDDCDPHNKWYVYCGESLVEGSDGLWHISLDFDV